MAEPSNNPPPSRLQRLLGFLEQDAGNLSLLAEAAEAALAEREPQTAKELLDRYAAITPWRDREIELAGRASLETGAYEEAAARYGELLAAHPADPALKFNRAFALAMLKRFGQSLALLDEAVAMALAPAAALKVQLLHELGRFDEAADHARLYVQHHPDHRGLMAVVSVLAVDVEDFELARACAQKAGDHPDALTTLAMLALAESRDDDAAAMFDRALMQNESSPRAWIGKGLTELAAGAYRQAARDIERGAELFGDHIGSWIALGWARLLSEDLPAARAAFQHALELDRNFAESHGSLAVVMILEGCPENAKAMAETALRLDRKSFAGALARALLLEAEGKPELAQSIVERALNTPIDATGATVAQALAKRALFA